MTTYSDRFQPFARRMEAAGLPDIFINMFAHYYDQLVAGETGLIPESEIEPVSDLPDAETLPRRFYEVGEEAMGKTAVIKLNGGLGTSMGLEQAKSLLPVKNGLAFLDIIARQAVAAGVPLLLMNSFVTEDDSLQHLSSYDELGGDLPLSFVQHKEPKVDRTDLSPVSWPQDPELEWCPPGHGDIYTALVTRGALEALLEAGYEYAFVSNADNLGAVVDPAILGYFAHNDFPFMMEVADRTTMDKKGGHLAQCEDEAAEDGRRFLLRESAQCPPADKEAFQDVSRHKYFNTNNLWLNLLTLRRVMEARDNRLGLPMIRNEKTVDPRDPDSTPVYQLETAMGSAIAVFPGAQAIRVSRRRFAPVKKTNDLLAVRSDAYVLTDAYHVLPHPDRREAPLLVTLDDNYKFVNQFDAAFPAGPPSLLGCTHFEVRGKFIFGRDLVAHGQVRLINESDEAVTIEDGTVLSGEYRY